MRPLILSKGFRVTPANVNDGKAGCDVVPDKPGQVYADSAYRGVRFRTAVEDWSSPGFVDSYGLADSSVAFVLLS